MPRLTDPIGPNICPTCGERVSAFAAGCAVCGAELDPSRGQGKPSPVDKVRHLSTFLKTRRRPKS